MRIPLGAPAARRRLRSASAFSTTFAKDGSELTQLLAILLVIAFVAWTAATRVGIARGSRPTAWVTQPFGRWPASLGQIEGSAHLQLSLFASFVGGGSVGMTGVGTSPDFGDGGAINGSRFVTGPTAGNVASMSVHVRGPLDEPSRRQFQLAIYSDHDGAPGSLIAESVVGTLTADTWNTVPLITTLEPATPYWLMYNTNASRPEFNNATISSLSSFSLEQLFDAARSPESRDAAHVVRLIGHPIVSGSAIVLVALWAWFRNRQLSTRIIVAAATGGALEATLKMTAFQPYGSYPSGHALRLTFLAVVVSQLSRRRTLRTATWIAAAIVAAASVVGRDHYMDEIVGGALAGAALAILAVPVSLPVRPKPHVRETAPVWVPGRDRRAVKRPGPDRRRAERQPSREFEPLAAARQMP